MNTETVRSLTEALKSVAAIIKSKGENVGAFAHAKKMLAAAIYTENDLRGPEFVKACDEVTALAPHQEHKSQVKAAVVSPVKVASSSVSEGVPMKSPSADLTAKKAGWFKSERHLP